MAATVGVRGHPAPPTAAPLRAVRADEVLDTRAGEAYDISRCLADGREPLVDGGPPPRRPCPSRAGRLGGCARVRSGSAVVPVHRPPLTVRSLSSCCQKEETMSHQQAQTNLQL